VKDQERRDLFARARDGATPSDDDRRRVRAALHRKLGVGAAAAVGVTVTKAAAGMAPSAAVTGAVSGVSAAVVAKALVLVAVVAAASWVVIPQHSAPTRVASSKAATTVVSPASSSASAISAAARAPSPVSDDPVGAIPEKTLPSIAASHSLPAPVRTSPVNDRDVHAAVTPQSPAPSPVESPATGTPQPAEDVALLTDIQLALRDGDSTRVLALVREHERRFPASTWGPEREGARVLALCSQSQPDEAMRIGQRFLGDHPLSPLAARVRSTCRIPDPSR